MGKRVFPNGSKVYKLAKMRRSFHSPKAKAARVQAYAGRKYRR